MAGDMSRLGEYVVALFKGLMFWRRPSPVTTPAELASFAETRSKFVAQMTLYGYLKTRAGTRYVSLFEDETFLASINLSKWEIYFACLADLTIHAVANVGAAEPMTNDELGALAAWCYRQATEDTEPLELRPGAVEDARAAFAARLKTVDWQRMGSGDAAFSSSPGALVEWAPVAPELKQFDTEIVANSLRFKWKSIRDELGKCLDGPAVGAGWRGLAGPAEVPSVEMVP